ncbi:unnamed protein product [Oppiella nova]|uniref:Uncharacterized protein n=1 Tax=Oppiella nova TaxID=334625 RepID=A0A7R9M1L6_9ACAR|nr:unnamed protein product [Oppiella nova]CAG2169072.1 unnamed protein product [Oppiella nova]
MSVVILLTGRIWTSVSATELQDHIGCDGLLNGPTYIARDQVGIPPEESQLYKYLNARMIKEKVWSTNLPAATVIGKLISFGYKLISQAGSGVGFSGKARYSADVAVTDYRWSWTLVKENLAPPPYPDQRYHPME